MSNDIIADSMDMAPLTVMPQVQAYNNGQVTDDFEYARGNMIAAIEKGQEALSAILDVANMSQHPRAYEVAAKLLDSVSSANKDLLELQKRKADLTGIGPKPTTVNNNLFVGSTAELQQLIKKQNEQSK
jgi:hypothetical protein